MLPEEAPEQNAAGAGTPTATRQKLALEKSMSNLKNYHTILGAVLMNCTATSIKTNPRASMEARLTSAALWAKGEPR